MWGCRAFFLRYAADRRRHGVCEFPKFWHFMILLQQTANEFRWTAAVRPHIHSTPTIC